MMNIVKRDTIAQIVQHYNDGLKRFQEAYTILGEAGPLMDIDFYGYGNTRIPKEEDVISESKRRIWRKILDLTGILQAVTVSKAREISDQVESGKLPDITVDNISQMLNNLVEQIPDMMDELITTVFRYLRPGQCKWETLKTNIANGRYEIGEKIILKSYIDNCYSNIRVRYGVDANILLDIDKLFYMLEGKGIPQRPYDIVTKINDECRKDNTTLETDYYYLKWFPGNGNIHMKFKRMDLVKEINAKAASITELKPA